MTNCVFKFGQVVLLVVHQYKYGVIQLWTLSNVDGAKCTIPNNSGWKTSQYFITILEMKNVQWLLLLMETRLSKSHNQASKS